MAATARMILQVEPAEKARWTAKAREAGISTSEFVRRAAADHDPDLTITADEAELLRLLAIEVNAAADRIEANLDAIGASIREMVDPRRDEQLRLQVCADIEASGERLDLSKLRALAE